MKQLEITVTIRNNLLKERRVQLGWTQQRLCKEAKVSPTEYGQLEALKGSPRRKDGGWKVHALRIAEFYFVDPEELFPQELETIENTSVSRTMDVFDAQMLLGEHSAVAALPEALHDERDLVVRMHHALDLLPPKLAVILRMRFGLDGYEPHTFQECGEQLGLTRERIRQKEARALRMLRHPDCNRELQDYR